MHVLVPRVPSMEIGLFESFGFAELQDTFCVAWDSNGLVMSCVRLLSEGLCTAIASAVDKKLMASREFRARMASEISNILKASLGRLGRWVDGSIDCERKCSRLISDEEFKSSWLGSHLTGSAKPHSECTSAGSQSRGARAAPLKIYRPAWCPVKCDCSTLPCLACHAINAKQCNLCELWSCRVHCLRSVQAVRAGHRINSFRS